MYRPHVYGRFPWKNLAVSVAKQLTFPGGLTYSATYRPSARYPDAPWLVEGRWADEPEALGPQAMPPLPEE